MLEYIIILLGVSIFGMQHSGVSSLRVKDAIIDRWGKGTYGTLFTATSLITFIIAFLSMNYWDWLYFIINPELIEPLLVIPGVLSLLVGLVVAQKAGQVISVSTVADMRTDREPELITEGIYGRVRHPLYLATILIFTGLGLMYPFIPVLVFSLGMIVYTFIGAYLEEKKLVLFYGAAYHEYKKQAGFIIPRIR